MVIAGEFGSGQMLWIFLWFFMFVIWIGLLFSVLIDAFRSDDLSGVSKAIWVLVLIVLPLLGVFVYLVARGDDMGRRQYATMKSHEYAVQDHIRETADGPVAADQLATLADLHAAGKLTDEEHERAKDRVLP